MNKSVTSVWAYGLIIIAFVICLVVIHNQFKALNRDIDAISATQAVIRAPGQIGTGISTTTVPSQQ